MWHDPAAELRELALVCKLHLSALEKELEHPIPLPEEVSRPPQEASAAPEAVRTVRQWLSLAGRAMSPGMLRVVLREVPPAEALLRFYAERASPHKTDQDKTDLVATFLCRQWLAGQADDDVAESAGFQAYLREQMRRTQELELPAEYRELLRQLEAARQEVAGFAHFNQILDSELVGRTRQLKRSFAAYFYHPEVLTSLALHNVYFGHRFDELLQVAGRQLQEFVGQLQQDISALLQQPGGSRMVARVAAASRALLEEEGSRPLTQEALELRRLSLQGLDADAPLPDAGQARIPAPAARARTAATTSREFAPATTVAKTEETLLQDRRVGITNFVRSADPETFTGNVPLRDSSVKLSPAQVEAFRAPYSQESSFRGEYAALLIQLVVVASRIKDELGELHAKKDSKYLWQVHAESLAYLLTAANRVLETSGAVLSVAEQRGLAEKATALNETLQQVRELVNEVAAALKR